MGDVTTDAMRAKYGPIGVEFAITNSGGLRDRLTCPAAGGGSGFCPPSTPPPHVITRGQVLAVLPFGNVVVTLTVNGAELKTMLENGVSSMPGANGRFPQVSGLCFTYDIDAAVGSRIQGAVRQAADGTCTGAPVDPLARYFEYWLLRLQGVYPSFECTACGGSLERGAVMPPREHVLVCRECAPAGGTDLSVPAVRFLRAAGMVAPTRLDTVPVATGFVAISCSLLRPSHRLARRS